MTYRKFPHQPRHTPAWSAYKAAVVLGLVVVILLALTR